MRLRRDLEGVLHESIVGDDWPVIVSREYDRILCSGSMERKARSNFKQERSSDSTHTSSVFYS